VIAWRCPACATPIPLSALETHPRPRAVYRCPVCRLELTYDETRGILDVPPIDGETTADPRARTTR
jgi:rubredoxin